MGVADIISLLLYLNAIVVIVLLIYEERDPSTTLAWALALILLPGLGIVLYALFGRNWRTAGARDKRRAEAEKRGHAMLAPVYARWSQDAQTMLAEGPAAARRIAASITAQNETRPLPCTGMEILADGESKFSRLFADIEAAKHSVHLEYFIWENDELTQRLVDLLERKLSEGVEVRILYDWVGSFPYSKQQLRHAEKAGAKVHADSAHWSKINYRNHRKIAVIDGRWGYTGGMNMGQEYIDGGSRFATWRDTHVRVGGPLVADLQRLFADRWYRVTAEDLFEPAYFPELGIADGERPVWAQMSHSGAESQWEALRNTLMLCILAAEKRVRVQSPYFVPDEPIMSALVTQSLAGVDVELMMTGIADKRVAWNAAFSYIDELVAAGGRVYQYDAGFFHPKTVTIDGEICVIGTTNFDIRSLMLHDELSLFFYDRTVTAEQDALFEADLASCHEVSLATYERFTRVGKFGNALARLWSRLL